MTGLFRQEIFDAKRDNWLGSVRLATPLSLQILTLASLALGVAIIAFLIFGHYTRRERVEGTLAPTDGLMEVTAASPGTVTQLMVEQGAIVREGAPLIALSSEHFSVALGGTAAAINEQLKLQRARIEADLADQDKLELDKTTGFNANLSILRAQLTQVDAQLAIQKRQVENAHATLTKIRPLLAKGYISALQIQQQETSTLDTEALAAALQRQRLEIEQQIRTQEDLLRQLPLTLVAQKRELERKRAEIEQSIAENEVQRGTMLRAPRDGIVSSLLVRPGQTVNASQTLLTIVPENSLLEAQLLVPSSSIGFVTPGDSVVLHYHAFPYQKFGLHFGKVKVVSQNPLMPTQIATFFGKEVKEPMYRISVEIDSQNAVINGKRESLKPGMILDAEILLDQRSLIEWIFEPLYGIDKQMRG